MPSQIVRRLKPEEEEILRKREELAAIRATLADREFELIDCRHELAIFEGRYLRQVGTLYAELDEWKARLSELQAMINPSAESTARAEESWEQARQTRDQAHGTASNAPEVELSSELKSLYRDVAKRVHPDLSQDPADRERRTRFMAEANRAYGSGDADSLRRILEEFHDAADDVEGEGIGAELIRIIRQISHANARMAAIDDEMAALRESEIAQLKIDVQESEQAGRDLLAELATAVKKQIEQTKNTCADLAQRIGHLE